MSDSRAAAANDQEYGMPCVLWNMTRRALTSKGKSRARVGAWPHTPVLVWAARANAARAAKALRKPASRAKTGVFQPCSSVEHRLVTAAPVKASGPVQIRCCAEGASGLRRKFRFSEPSSGGRQPSAPSGVEARFSIEGRAGAGGTEGPTLTLAVTHERAENCIGMRAIAMWG